MAAVSLAGAIPTSLHRDALRQVARLVHVRAFGDGDVVGEELQGDGVYHR